MTNRGEPLAEFITDQLCDWAPIAARRMFGGWGIYQGHIMFGLIADEAIYFRVDDGNRADFEAAGTEPFRYTMPNGKIMEMAYYAVPAHVLEEPEELARWAAKAYGAALKVAREKAAKKAKTGAKAGAKRVTSRAAKAVGAAGKR